MLAVICGHRGRMTCAVLSSLLAEREHREAQTAYIAQTLWLLNDRMDALIGMQRHLPRYDELFPARRGAAPSAGEIRRQLLHGLEAESSTQGKEETNCLI